MVRKTRAGLTVFIFGFSVITAPLCAETETAQDLADGIIYARGGSARIQNIQTERMSGTLFVGDRQGTFVREIMRPNKIRMEVTIEGETTTMTFNGASGWKLNVTKGSDQPQPLNTVECKKMAEDADVDGPFLDFTVKNAQIELLDKEMLGPSLVWKLKVTRNNGDAECYYVESTGHYILMREKTSTQKGKSVTRDTVYKDFQHVEGVLFPFRIVSGDQDSQTTLQFDKIQLNTPLDASEFEKPSAAQASKPKK